VDTEMLIREMGISDEDIRLVLPGLLPTRPGPDDGADPAAPFPPLVDLFIPLAFDASTAIVATLTATGLQPATIRLAINDLFAPEVDGIATAAEIDPALVRSIVSGALDFALATLED
jgi:hypothetical protein